MHKVSSVRELVFPVLLYGAETWRIPSLASPLMHKLRVFFHRRVRSMNDVDMEKARSLVPI